MKNIKYRILQNKDIDLTKWNSVVKGSINESPLAYSEVLNILSPQWEGVIVGDYVAVMPLPVQKRLGYKLIQMPKDIQNFGLFSPVKELLNIDFDLFSTNEFNKFRFISYSFVFQNSYLEKCPDVKKRTTYFIDLGCSYEDIYSNYTKSHRKNLRRFSRNDLTVFESNDPEHLFKIRQSMGNEIPQMKMTWDDEKKWEKLIGLATTKNTGKIIYVKFKGNIVSGGFYLRGTKRDVLLLLGSSYEGKDKKASFGVIDHYLKTRSGQNQILDFCGSDISGIASFFEGFGASKTSYIQYKKNQLPYLVKLMKEHNVLDKVKKRISL